MGWEWGRYIANRRLPSFCKTCGHETDFVTVWQGWFALFTPLRHANTALRAVLAERQSVRLLACHGVPVGGRGAVMGYRTRILRDKLPHLYTRHDQGAEGFLLTHAVSP